MNRFALRSVLPAAGFLGVGLRQSVPGGAATGCALRALSRRRGWGLWPAAEWGAGEGQGKVRALRALWSRWTSSEGCCRVSSTVPAVPDFLHTVPASYVALEDMKLVEPMMRRLAMRAALPPEAGVSESEPSPVQTEREPTQSSKIGSATGCGGRAHDARQPDAGRSLVAQCA